AKLAMALKDPAQVAVVLSAQESNEANYLLAKLAAAWKVTNLFVATRPANPERADEILRDADVDPNAHGVKRIAAAARPVSELEAAINAGSIRAVVALGNDLALGESARGRLADLDAFVVLAWRELASAKAAQVALPIAAWAETSGSITNRKGSVQ